MPKRPKIEFRYYMMPADRYILAVLEDEGPGEGTGDGEGNTDSLHFHNYMEIGYCHEGSGQMILGGKAYPFSAGCCTIIPRNCPHMTCGDPGVWDRWEYLFVDAEDLLKEFCRGLKPRGIGRIIRKLQSEPEIRPAQDRGFSGKILEILEIMRGKKEHFGEEARGYMAALLIGLSRERRDFEDAAAEGQPPEAARWDARADISPVVAYALDYIAAHYMEPLNMDELAGTCHLSQVHFRRIFSACMNMTPVEYVNRIRIHNACEYLRKTDRTVADIARRCGFTTQSTFHRNFVQLMGVTPREWRKRPENLEQQQRQYEIMFREG